MRPDESRCRELVEWPEPTSRGELWSYLGLYAYLAHTMPQSTTVALRQLFCLEKDELKRNRYTCYVRQKRGEKLIILIYDKP
jgi:hypothetical protein